MIMNLRGAGGKKPVLQSKSVTPGSSDQTVTPDEGYEGMSSVTVSGDSNLVAGNIRSGADIFGVSGSLSYKYQSKTVTPSSSSQNVYADSGYSGLYSVTVSGSSSLSASNIKYGVNIFGVTGSYEHNTSSTISLGSGSSSSFSVGLAKQSTSETADVVSSASHTKPTYTVTKGEISGNLVSCTKASSGSVSFSTTSVSRSYYGTASGSVSVTLSTTLPAGSYSISYKYYISGTNVASLSGSGSATFTSSGSSATGTVSYSVKAYAGTSSTTARLYLYPI